MNAQGKFEVNLQPMESFHAGSDGVNLGRMSIDKTFTGDLQAHSLGEMLSAMTTVKGSAGYVALEQVNGSLNGKTGTFVLQHYGQMNAKGSLLILDVVPDSGTGELAAISGKMTIDNQDGVHRYEFDYSLD